jgi:hypothetical protein
VDDQRSKPRCSSNISYRSIWRLRHEVGIDYSDVDLAVALAGLSFVISKNAFLFHYHYAFRSENGIVVIDCFHRAVLSSTIRSINEKGPVSKCGNRFAQEAS